MELHLRETCVAIWDHSVAYHYIGIGKILKCGIVE